MWYVYILLCTGNRLYTGITPDLEARFKKHTRGIGSRFTRAFKPLKIVYSERCPDKSTALKREAEIKKWSHRKKLGVSKSAL